MLKLEFVFEMGQGKKHVPLYTAAQQPTVLVCILLDLKCDRNLHLIIVTTS